MDVKILLIFKVKQLISKIMNKINAGLFLSVGLNGFLYCKIIEFQLDHANDLVLLSFFIYYYISVK